MPNPMVDAVENGRIIIIKNLTAGNVTSSLPYVDSDGTSTSLIGVGVTWLQYDLTNTVWHQIN